jgi:hypothetical protein
VNRKRRDLLRKQGERRYKKVFYLAVEGTKTEPQYFKYINNIQKKAVIKMPPGQKKGLSPKKLVESMGKWLTELKSEKNFWKDDQAWLVFDTDSRDDEQIRPAHDWATQDDNQNIAVSNPKFEYWLLLHFEDGDNLSTPQACDKRLNACLPNYKKQIDTAKFSKSMIEQAVRRAKQRDRPPCKDWPRQRGTTVYRLVEQLMD